MNNKKEFRKIYEQHYAYVLTVIHSRVQNRQTAEDICQEVFVRLYNNMDKIEDGKHRNWLLTALKFEISNYMNKKSQKADDITGTEEYVSDLDMQARRIDFVPVYFHTGHYFNLSDRFRFAPVISAGYAYCIYNEYTAHGSIRTPQHYSAVKAQIECNIMLFRGTTLVIDTGYSGFFRNGNEYHAYIVSLGVGMFF